MGSSIRVALVLLIVVLLCHCADNPTEPTKTNRPPALTLIDPQTVQEGYRLEFIVQASDSDGVVPTISATNLPTNASAVDSGDGTMLFLFEPDFTQSGTYNVTFIASDGQLADSETITITVLEAEPQVNHPPVLAEIGPQAVRAGDTLRFSVFASDQDSTIPLLFSVNLPRHSSFASAGNGSGLFTFAPDIYQIRMYSILFYASDGGLADSETIVVEVQAVGGPINHPPVLSEIGPQTVRAGDTLRFSVFASDQDGTMPSLFAENLPNQSDFLSAGDGSGLFKFAPDTSQIGIHSVLFYASDGELADSETITITVVEAELPVNHPPVLAEVGSQTVKVGDTLRFTVSASDQDGTIPSLFADSLPNQSDFLSAGDGSGLFKFAPDTSQIGIHSVLFYASDGELADSETITITVVEAELPVNHPPVLAEVGPQTVKVGDTLRFTVSASDQDGTIPSLFAENLPNHSSFVSSENGSGLFTFAPDTSQTMGYYVLFHASDGEFADIETVWIWVEGTHAPHLLPIPPQPCMTTIELRLVVAALDDDGTRPALSAFNLPTNSSFIDSGGGIGELSFTPDPTQLGVFEPRIVASDGQKSDTESVKITVSPYKSSDIWPMAIGNYWVYRVHVNWHSGSPGFDTSTAYPADAYFDTVFTATMNVLSSYQRDGTVHWSVSGGLKFAMGDVAFRNDSIVSISPGIAIPSVWPDRTDTVEAGVFTPTYHYWKWPLWEPSVDITFAKNVGVIKYSWFNGLAMHPSHYNAVLISYWIKQRTVLLALLYS